jgi:hypothetical protein
MERIKSDGVAVVVTTAFKKNGDIEKNLKALQVSATNSHVHVISVPPHPFRTELLTVEEPLWLSLPPRCHVQAARRDLRRLDDTIRQEWARTADASSRAREARMTLLGDK